MWTSPKLTYAVNYAVTYDTEKITHLQKCFNCKTVLLSAGVGTSANAVAQSRSPAAPKL